MPVVYGAVRHVTAGEIISAPVRNGFCSIGNRDLTGTIAILMADALLLRIIVPGQTFPPKALRATIELQAAGTRTISRD